MFTDAVSMLMLLIKVVLMSLSRHDGFLQEVLLVVDLIASVFASSGVPRRSCWIHLVVHLRRFYRAQDLCEYLLPPAAVSGLILSLMSLQYRMWTRRSGKS